MAACRIALCYCIVYTALHLRPEAVAATSLLSGNVTRLTRQHHGPAITAELGAMLEHACGNLRYVRNLAASKPEGVASAHLLRLRTKRVARA